VVVQVLVTSRPEFGRESAMAREVIAMNPELHGVSACTECVLPVLPVGALDLRGVPVEGNSVMGWAGWPEGAGIVSRLPF